MIFTDVNQYELNRKHRYIEVRLKISKEALKEAVEDALRASDFFLFVGERFKRGTLRFCLTQNPFFKSIPDKRALINRLET